MVDMFQSWGLASCMATPVQPDVQRQENGITWPLSDPPVGLLDWCGQISQKAHARKSEAKGPPRNSTRAGQGTAQPKQRLVQGPTLRLNLDGVRGGRTQTQAVTAAQTPTLVATQGTHICELPSRAPPRVLLL